MTYIAPITGALTPQTGHTEQGDGLNTTEPGWIGIVPIGEVDPGYLEFASLVLPETFLADVDVRAEPLDPAPAFDDSRAQTNATVLLQMLASASPPAGAEAAAWRRFVGITEVDLYQPVLTFVFGAGMLGGMSAVVSLRRLREENYGLPPDEDRLLARLEKELVHELGHTFDLRHCRDTACAMRFSNQIGDIDQKAPRLCEECRITIGPGTHPLVTRTVV